MKKIKILTMAAVVVMVAVLAVGLIGCDGTTVGGGRYSVVVPDGATYAALIQMRHERDDVKFTVGAGTAITTAITDGSADFVVAPTNVASSSHDAYNANNKLTEYKVAAVISWGVLHIMSTDPNMKPRSTFANTTAGLEAFLAQFDGKEVATIEPTAIPGKSVEFLLRNQNVKITGVAAPTVIVGDVKLGKVITGVLAEPVLTAIRGECVVLASIAELYREMTGQDFPMAALMVRAGLAESEPDFVAEMLRSVATSVEFFNNNPAQVGLWAEEYGDSAAIKAATIGAASAGMNIIYRDAEGSKTAVEELLKNLGMVVSSGLFL